jgi:hypothetical protein
VGNSIPAPKIDSESELVLPPVGTINLVFCTLDLYESQVTVDAQSGKLTQLNEIVSEQALRSAVSPGYDMDEEPWTRSDYLRPIADSVSTTLGDIS